MVLLTMLAPVLGTHAHGCGISCGGLDDESNVSRKLLTRDGEVPCHGHGQLAFRVAPPSAIKFASFQRSARGLDPSNRGLSSSWTADPSNSTFFIDIPFTLMPHFTPKSGTLAKVLSNITFINARY